LVEVRPLEKDVEAYRRSIWGIGNPIPIGTLLGWLLFAIAGIGGGILLWQFWNASQAVVQAIQQWAPLMAGAFTMLLYVLAMIPFFFIFQIVMSLLR
jgi:hypothetical protein